MKTKKITCIITGKSIQITKDYYDKKVSKAGGDESIFNDTYICKEAKDLLIQGFSVQQIREKYGITNLPPIDNKIVESLITNKYGIKKDTTFNTITSFTVYETDADIKNFINNICNE